MLASSSQAELSQFKGLSTLEAASRLQSDGANEFPGTGPRSLLIIARDVLAEPMLVLLLVAAGIYVLLGEGVEAIALSASILVVIVITILQERRTEHALARLRTLSDPQALVLRDGVRVRIPSREVVLGDLLFISEGDRIVADAVLLSATALSVDESILTGESLPVDKVFQQGSASESNCRAFAGTLVVHGFAIARVIATGARSEIGRIGRSLIELNPEVTPLFREVRSIVRWMAASGLLLCVLIALTYALSRLDWLGGVLVGITVAMSVLPEELPVVLTVFLAMGAWRLSRLSVLSRRMPAVETIGAASVLAVDKTGTLTENRMKVVAIKTPTARHELSASTNDLDKNSRIVLATALAACERDAFDPMEQAIRDCALSYAHKESLHFDDLQLCREYDLTAEVLAVTHVWSGGSEKSYEVAVKGAPETIFKLCNFEPEQYDYWHKEVTRYAVDGLRVLAVATGKYEDKPLPNNPFGFDLKFLGLIGLADPLRVDTPSALAECKQAGIRVVMITGDHVGTALSIAKQAGIDTRSGVLTGEQISLLDQHELITQAQKIHVYARMLPNHKLMLVNALKAHGDVVVMTGDGVNDAPALKAAHVGVAMGLHGTEVAREAASMVLLNNDFGALVQAVKMGRRIYENVKNATSFIIAVHIPIAGTVLVSTLLGWPLVLYPLHVMFLEFVIDPACSLAFEADAQPANLMRRPPRSINEKLFTSGMVFPSVARGLVMLLYSLAVYGFSLDYLSEEQARATAFVALVTSSLMLIFICRSNNQSIHGKKLVQKVNPFLGMICGMTFISLLLVLYVPKLCELFKVHAPPLGWTALVFAFGFIITVFTNFIESSFYVEVAK